jgi:hypothetical protein
MAGWAGAAAADFALDGVGSGAARPRKKRGLSQEELASTAIEKGVLPSEQEQAND